jgi:hypothetical protein
MNQLHSLVSTTAVQESSSSNPTKKLCWGLDVKVQDIAQPLFTNHIPDALKSDSGLIYNLYEILAPKTSALNTVFSLYAPQAKDVSLCIKESARLHLWSKEDNNIAMKKNPITGFWQVSTSLTPEQSFQYLITTSSGAIYRKLDPFTTASVTFIDPFFQYASKLYDPKAFVFTDPIWQEKKMKVSSSKRISLYHALPHLWKKQWGQMTSYRTFTHEITEHCKKIGASHVVLEGMLDHVDISCPNKPLGFFAPSRIAGGPLRLQEHINRLHMSGLGVIASLSIDAIDPIHFGLTQLDGTALLEKDAANQGELDFHKRFTASYLLSAIEYWINYFHIDGFILKSTTEIQNCYGIEMIKEIQNFLKKRHPETHLILDITHLDSQSLQLTSVLNFQEIDFSKISSLSSSAIFRLPKLSFQESTTKAWQLLVLMHTLPINIAVDMGQEIAQEIPWQQKLAKAAKESYSYCVDWQDQDPSSSHPSFDLYIALTMLKEQYACFSENAAVEYLPTLPGLIAYRRISPVDKSSVLCIHNIGDTKRSIKEFFSGQSLQKIFTTQPKSEENDLLSLSPNSSHIYSEHTTI